MLYKIEITDPSNKPIKGARLSFIQKTDNTVVAVFTSDAAGVIAVDSNDDLLGNQDLKLVIKAGGFYDSVTESYGLLRFDVIQFELIPKPANAALLLLLGAGVGVGAYHYSRKRNKKTMGAADAPRQISPLVQTLIAVGGLGVVAYFLLRSKEPNTDLPNYADAELKRLIAAGHGPTISESEASGYAATIVSAANDCGTDENAIWSVMQQMQNTADILLLISVYGIREYKGCFDGDYFGYHRNNLAETLTSELSAGWISDINQLFSNRGIAFKF